MKFSVEDNKLRMDWVDNESGLYCAVSIAKHMLEHDLETVARLLNVAIDNVEQEMRELVK